MPVIAVAYVFGLGGIANIYSYLLYRKLQHQSKDTSINQ